MPDVKLSDAAIRAAVRLVGSGSREEFTFPQEAGLRLRVGGRGAKWSALLRTPKGDRIRVALGTFPGVTADMARVKIQEARRVVEDGRHPGQERRTKLATVGELLDEYEARRLARLRTGKETRAALDTLFAKTAASEAASLTRADLARVIKVKAEDAPIYANRLLAYGRAFLNWCASEGHISANPLASMDAPGEEKARDRALNPEELSDVLNAARDLGYPFGHAIRLLVYLPMRREEIGEVRISELDLEGGIWLLPPERSKNGRGLRVPLPAPAKLLLQEAIAARGRSDGDLVFSTTGTTPASGWSRAKIRLDGLIAKGREARGASAMPPWRIHDLRRTFATNAVDLKIDPQIADRCLNHIAAASSSVVARIYQRNEFFDQRKEALESWAAFLRGLETQRD